MYEQSVSPLPRRPSWRVEGRHPYEKRTAHGAVDSVLVTVSRTEILYFMYKFYKNYISHLASSALYAHT